LPKFIEQMYFNLISGRKNRYFIKLNRITPRTLFKFLKKNKIKFKDLSLETVKNKNWFYRLLYKIDVYPQINLAIYK